MMSTTLLAWTMSASPALHVRSDRAMTNRHPAPKRARTGRCADRLFGWLAKGVARVLTLAVLLAILVSLTIECLASNLANTAWVS